MVNYILDFEELIDIIPSALYVVKDSTIIKCNNAALGIFGYETKEELIGMKPYELSPERQEDGELSIYKGKKIIEEAAKGENKCITFQWLHKRKSGESFLADIEIYNKNGLLYILIADINENHQLKQKDSLTKLYNREFFLEKVDNYIKDNIEFSLISIDLDGLKDINDSIGHVVGDQLLVDLSNRLQNIMNEDCLLARFSGGEFVILYKSLIDENDIKRFSNILVNNIKNPFTIYNNILNISANIGISRYPIDATNVEALVRFADIAMTNAKEQTEEKICFYTNEMSKVIEEKFLLTNYLVAAIPNNELAVYYQPIFDIREHNKIVGAEALLRWKNPTLGMIPPNKFIPLAEKTGLIIAIGEWVVDQVCKQINLWESKGYFIKPIAINISVKQLEQMGFAQNIIDILKKYKLESNSIELEITESISTGDILTIVKNLKLLKDIGIRISMDDFGTGFSSLGQLDLFELDKLKIDKIFIDDLVNVSKRQNLVKSIIAMAKSLNLTVVAEGIETDEQLFYLKKLGCHLGQGYLFSKPIPAKDIEILLDPVLNQ